MKFFYISLNFLIFLVDECESKYSEACETYRKYFKQAQELIQVEYIDYNETVAWNEEKQRRLADIRCNIESVSSIMNTAMNPVIDYIKNTIMRYGFNQKQADVIYSYVYGEHHSAGYMDVYSYCKDICELVATVQNLSEI